MDLQQRTTASPLSPPPPARQSHDSTSILFTFLSFFAIVALVLLPSASPSFQNSLSILHQVPEGHVGVYWRGGALLKTITEPGFHLKMPFITQYEPVQVTLQTDMVIDIPCGTKGGVMISFGKIEIDEKMKDALQVDCTRYAPGIEILSVRVTKPTIPESIRCNFEQMEEERTKVLIAIEKQKVSEKEAETMKKMAISEAEKNANVSKILMEQKLLEKDSARRQEEIENAMYLAREKSLADADFYRVIKEAEANRLKLTPEFLQLKFIQAIANNTKIFFGDKVPNMILDQRLLGNLLHDVSRGRTTTAKADI
ncbi:erlin-2-like isoform X2 [Glycine soja]|uniref:Erlin-2-B isoform B n=1 Tax=Glycine soja TaxID=3848 RepID=A0A445K0C7_GLYSO|nr:erlin-2-like isoform X2 [Glycine soja]RZC04179.1 Erlin-2-B isoform B [Glycine soja]